MTTYHSNYPVKVPLDDELVEVECFFYFKRGYLGNYYNPTELSSVDILDITLGGVSVINELSNREYRYIEGALLAEMLADY